MTEFMKGGAVLLHIDNFDILVFFDNEVWGENTIHSIIERTVEKDIIPDAIGISDMITQALNAEGIEHELFYRRTEPESFNTSCIEKGYFALNSPKSILKYMTSYTLSDIGNYVLYDGCLVRLFYDSDITLNEPVISLDLDEDGSICGYKPGEYIETRELYQAGKVYECDAYAMYDPGVNSFEYTLDLLNIRKKK